MRILFSSGPMYGHVNTMLPLALAAQKTGHEVVVATGRDLVPHVERRGLIAWPVGLTHAEAGGSRPASWLDFFAAAARRRASDLVPRAIEWKPDLVIHEETELAGAVVAARSGARHVVHGLGVMPSMRVWQAFVSAIDDLGAQWGVPDITARLREATYLHICPPALQPLGERLWQHVLPLRPTAGMPVVGERLPAAIDALPYKDTIHLTLGTVFNEATEVFATAIAALRDLPCNLVVTVGPGGNRLALGPQPANVRIEEYLSHTLLLPRCRLVVSHGGAGIMLGALSYGLPQLVMPQGADQFVNADACRHAGAALSLAPEEVTSAAIVAAANRLLNEPPFTLAARAVRAQIDVMPDPRTVLAALAADEMISVLACHEHN
jgi:UDP:flavonoid glycosyltransferase YjiC (YdhE family)